MIGKKEAYELYIDSFANDIDARIKEAIKQHKLETTINEKVPSEMQERLKDLGFELKLNGYDCLTIKWEKE